MIDHDTKIAKVLAEARDQHGKVFGVMAAISMAGFGVSSCAQLEGNDSLVEIVNDFIAATLGLIHAELAEGEFTQEEFAAFMMESFEENHH